MSHGRGEFPQAFGRYTVLGRLGAGGMADALLAMQHGDLGFQKPMVVKRMHASLGRDSHFVKMFLDEARLAARLNHPNVVTTSEVGECDGHYFIAMEYLEGISLDRVARKYIQDGRDVPLGLLLRVLCDCLEGLHYAHELRDYDGTALRVVHRDVTPSNLFVTYGGIAKVLDFGIAKAATQDEATRTGMLKGKLAYMSPEQFYAAPIDRRSDVWSMGVVVWEMSTGRRLFKGPNDAATYKNIMSAQVPPVGTYRDDAPSGLDDVIARALTRDRDQRYESADAMLRDLEAVLRAHYGTSRADVAAEMRASFGEVLEENRRAIREFSQQNPRAGASTPPPPSPDAHAPLEDFDEDATQVNGPGSAPALPIAAPVLPIAAPVRSVVVRMATRTSPVVRLPQAPPQEVAPLEGTEPYNDDDEPGLSTMVDAKLPEGFLASIPRPATIPGLRPVTPAPAGPVTLPVPGVVAQGAQRPYVMPAALPVIDPTVPATPFDPVPRDVGGARGARLKRAAVQAVGWVTLLAIVGGVAAGAWSQRGWITVAVHQLRSGEPPNPARVGSFQLRIVSEPQGAHVFSGPNDLGRTPVTMPVMRSVAAEHPPAFTLQLPGYTTVGTVSHNTLDAVEELRVTLQPVNPRVPPPAPAPPRAPGRAPHR